VNNNVQTLYYHLMAKDPSNFKLSTATGTSQQTLLDIRTLKGIVRTQITDFNGTKIVGVRLWTVPPSGGDAQPTYQGVNVTLKNAIAIAKAIMQHAGEQS
jgi:hypothetical protein